MAKGHRDFKNPFLNLLSELRTCVSDDHELFVKYDRVVGTDLIAIPLKNAKCIYQSVICADINNLSFKDGVFDDVLRCDVIEHIPVENKNRLFSDNE